MYDIQTLSYTAVLPLEKPTLEVTLMRPEICNQDSNFKLLGLTASFSPLVGLCTYVNLHVYNFTSHENYILSYYSLQC